MTLASFPFRLTDFHVLGKIMPATRFNKISDFPVPSVPNSSMTSFALGPSFKIGDSTPAMDGRLPSLAKSC